MIDKTEARATVQEFVLKMDPGRSEDWRVYEETVDKPYGWIFFFNHKRYVDEKDRRSRLAGNGPILVEKATGAIEQFGTGQPLEFYINQVERRLGIRGEGEQVVRE